MIKITSLKSQLMIYLSVILFSIDMTIAWMSYHDALSEIEELFDAELVQSARVLASMLSDEIDLLKSQEDEYELPVIYNGWEPLAKKVNGKYRQKLHRYESNIAFQVWSPNKKLWAHSLNDLPENIPIAEPGFHTITQGKTSWRVFIVHLPRSGAWMITAANQKVRDNLSSDIASHIIVGHLLVLPILILLINLIINRAFRPLESLGQQIQKRHLDHLEPISMDHAPKEVYPLMTALNILLERVKRSWQQQKDFIADAAHELRTPLAALKVHAQNLGMANTLTEAKESAHFINQVSDRCHQLIQQLLTLARQEQGMLAPTEKIEMTPFLRDIISQYMPLALKKQQHLEFSADESIVLYAQRDALKILIGNLINNAIRYTPDHGRILCSAYCQHHHFIFEIEDDGPGIPPEEREKVFQRFYRIHRPHQAEGTGLGLAICQKICEQIHGELTIKNASNTTGACFQLKLPYDARHLLS